MPYRIGRRAAPFAIESPGPMTNDPFSRLREQPARLFILRRPALWIALWLVLEALAIKILGNQVGFGTALMLLILKSGLGLLVVIGMTGRALAGMLRRGFSPARFERIGIGLLAGLMLMMPGIVLSILVLGLIAPGVRAAIQRQFAPPPVEDGIIDLEPGQWRDVTPEAPTLPRRE